MSLGTGGLIGVPPEFISAFVELKFEQKDLENILVGDILNNPHIFARWNVTEDPTQNLNKQMQFGGGINGISIVDAGAGNMNIAVVTSTDNGTTWNTTTLQTASFGGFANLVDSAEIPLFQLPASITDIAFVAYNSNGATSGRIGEIYYRILVGLPAAYVLTKVV